MSEQTGTENGGSAFPRSEYDYKVDTARDNFQAVCDQSPGMTLRDYFAAKAMDSIFSYSGDETTYAEMATRAYVFADAMLKARSAS